ncbi:hypothetical protein SHIRM173S_07154 [Streptomyces hirsutus]
MPRSRSPLRSAALALAAAPLVMTLAACGGSDSANSGDSEGKTAAGGTERVVQTAFGEVKIDGTPKKVVTLSDVSLDTALSLDITPVGTSAARGAEGAPAYLSDRAADIPLVATVREPNTEAILKAEPDLSSPAPTWRSRSTRRSPPSPPPSSRPPMTGAPASTPTARRWARPTHSTRRSTPWSSARARRATAPRARAS